MGIVWGLVIVILSIPCWLGQVLSWFWPRAAVRMSLMEAEKTVEPTYFADIRGEAAWDGLTLWTLPTAGILLAIDNPAWPYLALAGGAVYVYFAGRGLFTRVSMRRRGYRVGAEANVKLGYAALVIWGLLGAIVVFAAVLGLAS